MTAQLVQIRVAGCTVVEASGVEAYNKELFAPFKEVNPNTTLTQEATAFAAHQFWADLFIKHKVSPTSQALKDAGIGSNDAFASGKIAMYLHSTYRIWQALRPQIKDIEWDIAQMPKGPAGRAPLISGRPSHALSPTGQNKERA